MEIFKLFGSIFIDNDEANKSIAKTGKESDGLVKKMGKGIKSAGKWAAAIGAAAIGIGTAAFAMTKKVTGAFDDIAKNSRKMGISTDYYQEMEYWASQNGLSNENMEKSLKRLNQRIGEARAGNEKYSDALKNLGVDMKAVENGTLSTEDAMTQSIQALSEMTNEQDKSALASEIFGKKLAQELMPAIDAGALSIDEAKEKAKELGIVIEEDTLNAAEEFNDTWDDMTRMMTAFGQKIFAQLMPAFQSMMDWIMEHMPEIQAVFTFVFDIISTAVSTVITWIGNLIGWITTLYESSEGTLTMVWEVIQDVFSWIIEFLAETWEFISEMWSEYGEQILETIVTVFTSVFETVKGVFTSVWDTIKSVMELILPFIQQALGKIFEFWDKNGKEIMEAVKNVFSIIQETIKFVMGFISGFISSTWGNISGIFNAALDGIMGLIKIFSSLFTGNWSGLWEGIKNTTGAIWDGIVQVIKAPINLIIGLVNGMIGGLNKIKIKLPKIPDWVPGLGGKGGGTIGFNIPKIPSLAVGGVVHDPTLAMIGDAGAGNPEIVTPEKLMEKIVRRTLDDYGGFNKGEVVSYADMFRGAIFNIGNEEDIDELVVIMAKKLGDYITRQKRKAGIV